MTIIALLILHLSTYVFDLLGYRFIPSYEDTGTCGILGMMNLFSAIGLFAVIASTEARKWVGNEDR